MWAYEVLAGVQFEKDVVATKDVGILWDAGFGIGLVGPLARKGLVGILQGIDKTFRKQRKFRFRAVKLLAPERRGERQLRLAANKDDLVTQQIWELNDLLETPPPWRSHWQETLHHRRCRAGRGAAGNGHAHHAHPVDHHRNHLVDSHR